MSSSQCEKKVNKNNPAQRKNDMYPNWCIYHLIVHSQYSEPHLCRKRHQRMRDKDNYSRSASQHERQFCKIMTRAVASKMKTETLASDILLSVFDVFSHLNQPENLEGEFNHAHCPSHDLFFWIQTLGMRLPWWQTTTNWSKQKGTDFKKRFQDKNCCT